MSGAGGKHKSKAETPAAAIKTEDGLADKYKLLKQLKSESKPTNDVVDNDQKIARAKELWKKKQEEERLLTEKRRKNKSQTESNAADNNAGDATTPAENSNAATSSSTTTTTTTTTTTATTQQSSDTTAKRKISSSLSRKLEEDKQAKRRKQTTDDDDGDSSKHQPPADVTEAAWASATTVSTAVNASDYTPHTVFVSGLPKELSKDDIGTLFARFGDIESINYFQEKMYAFVKYVVPDVVETVVSSMHGSLVAGHSVRVVRARSQAAKIREAEQGDTVRHQWIDLDKREQQRSSLYDDITSTTSLTTLASANISSTAAAATTTAAADHAVVVPSASMTTNVAGSLHGENPPKAAPIQIDYGFGDFD